MTDRNILVIICDQLSALALEAYGNKDHKAPHLDGLARESMVFDQAYCTTALCQPSRASFWTSRYPHETKIDSNMRQFPFESLDPDIETLGEQFSKAGYTCIHFGKEHDYGSLRAFRKIASEEIQIERDDPALNYAYETFLDIDTTDHVLNWLASSEAKEGPFLAVADMQNPHNICFYIGENQGGPRDFLGNPDLPELPFNFETEDMATRPDFVQYMCCAHRRLRHAAHWSEEDYRHYLYAYYAYIDIVDKQIGQILDRLEQQGLDENTLVVLMADHGEGMAAHRMVTKYGSFYENVTRVPFMFRLPKKIRQDQAGKKLPGLASLLDLKPTLAGYAGLEASPEDRGQNLWPEILSGGEEASTAPYVVSQWQDEFIEYTVPGRMYRFEDYKYIVYRDFDPAGGQEIVEKEEFYDLAKDPGETKNLIRDASYQDIIERARQGLKAHIEKVKDPFCRQKPDYDRTLYRKHEPGYWNHEGLSAVEIYTRKRDGLM